MQRRASRKQKRSKNWEKAQIKVSRLHHKTANTRKDFHLKIAHQLCDQTDSIFVEDIDYRVMAKGFLGKDSLDASFGEGASPGDGLTAVVDRDLYTQGAVFVGLALRLYPHSARQSVVRTTLPT